MEIIDRIADLCLSIVNKNEVCVPDLVTICRYKLGDGSITRDDVMMALRRNWDRNKSRYAPYYDTWRPPLHDKINRKAYISNLPVILQRLIAYDLLRYVRDEKLWKRRHVYQSYIDEMDVGWP